MSSSKQAGDGEQEIHQFKLRLQTGHSERQFEETDCISSTDGTPSWNSPIKLSYTSSTSNSVSTAEHLPHYKKYHSTRYNATIAVRTQTHTDPTRPQNPRWRPQGSSTLQSYSSRKPHPESQTHAARTTTHRSPHAATTATSHGQKNLPTANPNLPLWHGARNGPLHA